MTKYKVGDKIHIKSDLRPGSPSGVTVEMVQYSGKTATVTQVDDNDDPNGLIYQLDIDGKYWWWSSKMMEPIGDESCNVYTTDVHGARYKVVKQDKYEKGDRIMISDSFTLDTHLVEEKMITYRGRHATIIYVRRRDEGDNYDLDIASNAYCWHEDTIAGKLIPVANRDRVEEVKRMNAGLGPNSVHLAAIHILNIKI